MRTPWRSLETEPPVLPYDLERKATRLRLPGAPDRVTLPRLGVAFPLASRED